MWISGPIEGLENIFLLLQSTSSNDKRASLWMVKGQRVVCRDTLAQSNVIATSNEPGQATEKAEKDKAAHHQELCSFYIGGLHLPCCRGTMASGVSASLPCQMLGKLAQHEASLPHGGASSHHPSRTSPHAGQACPNVV